MNEKPKLLKLDIDHGKRWFYTNIFNKIPEVSLNYRPSRVRIETLAFLLSFLTGSELPPLAGAD